jgi:hypothetical protein
MKEAGLGYGSGSDQRSVIKVIIVLLGINTPKVVFCGWYKEFYHFKLLKYSLTYAL